MLEKISNRVYYMMNQDETDRPVLGVVIGNNSCLVIDAGNSPRHAREFQAELEAMGLPPIKYIALTHYHWDHSLGLSEWDAVSIANHTTVKSMDQYRQINYDDDSLVLALEKGILNEYAVKCIKSEIEDRDKLKIRNIDVSYTDGLKIDLGEVTCEIRHIISPHTEDSTIIYIPEEKTLFLGDCIYGCTKNGKNYFDKDKLFPMIDMIEQYQADYYLCAHESMCTKEEMVSYFQQLRTAYDIASKCKDLNEAAIEYKNCYNQELTGDMLFYMKSFGLD
ncbi:MAG: MBL fold metallo-hydrolase [Mobilitalea sp.]